MKHLVVFRSLLLAAGVLFMLSLKAQDTEKTVSLNLKNAKLSEALNAVRKSSQINLFYSVDDVNKFPPVTINVTNRPVTEVLNMLLDGTDMKYSIEKNTIIIKRKSPAENPAKKNPDTTVTVRGVVLNGKGQPLYGASVTDQSSGVSAITDASGKFSLITHRRTTLKVTYVGMKSQSLNIRAEGDSYIQNVTMEDAPNEMNQVVVTGYQNIRKSEMVGSANTIKRDEMFYDGTNTVEQMLQGKLPGTVVMNQTGMVGTRPRVRVRGTSTLLSNQEPVWVVDGVIQTDPVPFNAQSLNDVGSSSDMMRNLIGNSISWLNPNDIEDITVLKDAAATVLYGVKAANGVIVIKTKRGKPGGRMTVNYSGGFAITERLNYDQLNLMNSKERIDVSREIYEKRLLGVIGTTAVGYENVLQRYLNKEISYTQFNEEVKYLETVNTDWMKLLYRTPFSHNHSVSISGGSERLSYYSSLATSQNFGTAKGNDTRNMTGTLRLDAKISDKLTAGVQLNAGMIRTKGFYAVDPFKYAQETSRAIPAFDEDGNPKYYEIPGHNGTPLRFNVLNELAETGNQNDQRNFNASLNINYNIINGLRFESLLGLTSVNANAESWASEYSRHIAFIRDYEVGEFGVGSQRYMESKLPHGGEYNSIESRNTTYNIRNSLSWNKLIGLHRIGALAGQELRSTATRGFSSNQFGYFPDRGRNITSPPLTILQYGSVITNPLYKEIKNVITDRDANFLSYYGNLTYSYDERYVITGSLRSDASNRFGQDKKHRFLPIWAGGVRWNVHNEPWMKEQKLVSELNLRASYGWQGNVAENFGPDLIAQLPSNVVNNVTGEYELLIKSLGYADLRWEKTKTMNLGLDLGIASNRFIMSLEYYRKKTDDLIIYREIPVSYGIDQMPINGGKLDNEGIELSMSGTVIRSRDLVWNISFNTSRNRNRINSEIIGSESWRNAASGRLNKGGYGVSSFWVFDFTGLNPNDGSPEFVLPAKDQAAWIAGEKDATAYMKYAGRLEPDFTAGISQVLRYKAFTLSASFNMQLGGKKLLYQMFTGFDLPSAYMNMPKEFASRWKKPGDEKNTNIPSIPSRIWNPVNNQTDAILLLIPPYPGYEYAYEMYNYSTARVVDASFFRCNDISLTWNVPERLLKPLYIKNLSVSAAVRNPFIIVSRDFKGMDPEVATGNQPIPRVYSMQFNVSF
ncbi:SusC/RagA family TonB-linked outer membrane protein [Pseudobacter ginsenosidimutans]|uniref:TonB-linked SusC/RagA family outer membrane protein n=1 Tax=Pseudobacter ginsenosidimutans TaxID=661488 RepID=A0A4Q7MMN7_9BACT|nr:SusC/RagA family TonB-linked outer membrane protein [Pseudobacter ginsenosidimutans]QEC45758.1 SusC/RagA family TonB-linked outer membrane protein [Pseudobacter ginsenosidimutans]RZS69297.1 TonB-linked SusC/RagA family outer membrane protein [Pseudobacter ginsenosidimutans]